MIATVSFQYGTNDYAIRVLNNEMGTYEKSERKVLSDLAYAVHKLINEGLTQIFVEKGYEYIYDKANAHLFDYGYHFDKCGKVVKLYRGGQ